jgi:hypothetical protein
VLDDEAHDKSPVWQVRSLQELSFKSRRSSVVGRAEIVGTNGNGTSEKSQLDSIWEDFTFSRASIDSPAMSPPSATRVKFGGLRKLTMTPSSPSHPPTATTTTTAATPDSND